MWFGDARVRTFGGTVRVAGCPRNTMRQWNLTSDFGVGQETRGRSTPCARADRRFTEVNPSRDQPRDRERIQTRVLVHGTNRSTRRFAAGGEFPDKVRGSAANRAMSSDPSTPE